jgi:hypothetical protein
VLLDIIQFKATAACSNLGLIKVKYRNKNELSLGAIETEVVLVVVAAAVAAAATTIICALQGSEYFRH